VNPAYVPDSTSSWSTASPTGAHGGDGIDGGDGSSWAAVPGMLDSASRLAARRQPAPKERELTDRSRPRCSIGTLLHGVDVLHVAACDFIQASLRYCVHLELRTRHADPRMETSAWTTSTASFHTSRKYGIDTLKQRVFHFRCIASAIGSFASAIDS
jgi:hypothetical protein